MSSNAVEVTPKAWNLYIENDILDLQQLRPEVANSWQRCRNLNINPYKEEDHVVSLPELREKLFSKQHLLKVARPYLDNLYNFVKGSGFQVVLTDEEGYLLEVMGDNDIVSRTKRVLLCPGGNWSEAVKGTNAIGTAVVEKRPVQIYAWEHYCQQHHFLTCSAAPIFDADGEMVGILDISGDYRVANAHTLGMVVAAANAVENQLRLLRATDKLYMAYRYSNALLENMSDGLISINNSGIITEINAKGAEIFGVVPSRAKGRHVEQVVSARSPMLRVLADGQEYEDREIIIERVGKKIYSSASLLRDDSGGVIGVVAVFREIDSRHQTRRPTVMHSHCYTLDDIIGESPAIAAAKEWAKLAADSPSTVLINGESGTGKELFAQAIHNASQRHGRQFIALNCAALPETLIESELFGYEEGTFTGARKGGQAGKFEIADGGTIFLDEIGDMSLSVQAKLLRVLQEKTVSRIGSGREKPVDIRVIAATHKDLLAEVEKGNFRQDLYYRLNVLGMRIPALRERAEDFELLTRHLADKICEKLGKRAAEIEAGFLRKIAAHSWPGNIRELENALERAIIRSGPEGVLREEMFDVVEAPGRGTGPCGASPLDSPRALSYAGEQKGERSEPVKAAVGGDVKPTEVLSLRDAEKKLICDALAFYDGNIQKAAVKLGIGRNTLYRKMKEYEI
ncbi:sigma-54-dependent Fis family transcriptional regulator [Geomonas sp.]|uniref:sigma-54-dependent Fis family transcriptional regulator n=1 Tax=Geomonas sp. TaxID=2651584 RepID=UPI002B47DDA0|nr:sigma-54-dependent Fis family transcriptional regulator [Geomonas sp.]HJV36279.1 sigma-54-dependent Fis family transcriptional regulator [Geomonas sp.]